MTSDVKVNSIKAHPTPTVSDTDELYVSDIQDTEGERGRQKDAIYEALAERNQNKMSTLRQPPVTCAAVKYYIRCCHSSLPLCCITIISILQHINLYKKE
ncbi:hypothetical protein J6590_073067 [Homalodisca vitripennis]|nr:hypothetical protein J6590_073067 [Homalodisca vitripennis]